MHVARGPDRFTDIPAVPGDADPELCNRPDSPDLLDRYRARLMDLSEPSEVAAALLDNLREGPVCYAHPLDEKVSRSCAAMSRREAVTFKRAYHETQQRDDARMLRQ